jgi:A/G-specific adenine glycosylase
MLSSPDAAFSTRLLAWYDRHRRRLPWRADAGERPDPYRVWLSEVMLQQTTVAAVGPRFARFLDRWPTVEALAAAPLDDVLAEWAGLGYYARARNLHACAKAVANDHGGVFPASAAGLAALPGVGPYTAAAVAAIAFDEPVAAVDGNVERVIARHRAIATPMPKAKDEIRVQAAALVPAHRAGDFAQALMDLGATVCAPRKASCLACPVSGDCLGRASLEPERFPVKAAKADRPRRFGAVYWVEDTGGLVLLRRRPEKGLLGGMLEVPGGAWLASPPPGTPPPVNATWRLLPDPVEHTFTHFHLTLAVYRAETPVGALPEGGDWRPVARADLAASALPSVMRKVVAKVLGPESLKARR